MPKKTPGYTLLKTIPVADIEQVVEVYGVKLTVPARTPDGPVAMSLYGGPVVCPARPSRSTSRRRPRR
jgi:hypothetical protein